MRMPRVPWRLDPELLKKFAPCVWKPDEDPVELYYLPDDFSQANDLSASHPEKVKELQDLFWEEAEKYNIKPLLAGFSPFFGILPPLGSQNDRHLPRGCAERRPRGGPGGSTTTPTRSAPTFTSPTAAPRA